MAYNKKVLTKATKNLSKKKTLAKPKDIPLDLKGNGMLDPRFAGKPVKLNTDTLYNPTPYKIKAVADNGIEHILNPFDETLVYFPGANTITEYVDEFPKMQDGGETEWTKEDVIAANKKAQEFNEKYAKSKQYKRLLKKHGYSKQEIQDRINAVMNTNDFRYTNEGPSYVDFLDIGAGPANPNFISYNVTDVGDWGNWEPIAAHEWGHVGVDSELTPLKESERNELISRINPEGLGQTGNPEDDKHDMEPQENRADIVQFKQFLMESGIWDPTKRKKFTKKDLNKYKQLQRSSDENWVKYWNRMFRLYKDDDIIYLLNNIAAVDDGKELDIAEKGGYIEAELTDEEIEEYKKGGYIIEELPEAQDGRESPIKSVLDPNYKKYLKEANRVYKQNMALKEYDNVWNNIIEDKYIDSTEMDKLEDLSKYYKTVESIPGVCPPDGCGKSSHGKKWRLTDTTGPGLSPPVIGIGYVPYDITDAKIANNPYVLGFEDIKQEYLNEEGFNKYMEYAKQLNQERLDKGEKNIFEQLRIDPDKYDEKYWTNEGKRNRNMKSLVYELGYPSEVLNNSNEIREDVDLQPLSISQLPTNIAMPTTMLSEEYGQMRPPEYNLPNTLKSYYGPAWSPGKTRSYKTGDLLHLRNDKGIDTHYYNIPKFRGFEKQYKTRLIPNIVQKRSGYDEDYIQNEIERAEQEGRRINFKGYASLKDKKAQEDYNKAYDEYENKLAMQKLYAFKQGGGEKETWWQKVLREKEENDFSINLEGLKKGIAHVESADGVLMMNPNSSATGLYGQLFNEQGISDLYSGTREEFAKDIGAQNRIFEIRLNQGIGGNALIQDAKDLKKEYASQIKDFNKMFSNEDIIVLDNFLGRQGTRKYFGNVIRDGKSLAEVFPHLYGKDVAAPNHTPEVYLSKARSYYKKQGGGEKGAWIKKVLAESKAKEAEDAAYETFLDTFLGPKKETKPSTSNFADRALEVEKRNKALGITPKVMTDEMLKKQQAEEIKDRLNSAAETAYEFTVAPVVRTGERIIDNPVKFVGDVATGVSQIPETAVEGVMTLGSKLFGDGTNYIDVDTDALGVTADVIGSIPTFGLISKGAKPLLKTGLKYADDIIYPTRVYRASPANKSLKNLDYTLSGDAEKIAFEKGLKGKINKKGKFYTKDLEELSQYLKGNEGRRGVFMGDDMIIDEVKLPFWKKNILSDKDVVALKQSQGAVLPGQPRGLFDQVINENEFLIPDKSIFYPRKSTVIKAMPQEISTRPVYVRNYKGDIVDISGDFSPTSTPFTYDSPAYSNQAYKYLEDQINAATGHNIPLHNPNPLQEHTLMKNYVQPAKPAAPSFKSEIDWGKWNKEIPNNKPLMDEYLAIEESTKASGTWMKNPDGSAFKGTPEQFVQQQSQNFKNAFGESKLIGPEGSPMFLYHGSAKKFDTFDPSKFQLGDSGYSGRGIYTTPSKTTADSYALSSTKFHSGDIEPTVYELYGSAKNPISSEQLIKEGKNRRLFNFHRDANSVQGKLSPFESLQDYDAAVHNQLPNIERIKPWNDAWEIVFPKNTQLKSAVGNNGMFDMTNPNIYKALVPAVIGTAALQKQKKGGVANNYIETYISEEELQQYVDGGYIVEEVEEEGSTYPQYYTKTLSKRKNLRNLKDLYKAGKLLPNQEREAIFESLDPRLQEMTELDYEGEVSEQDAEIIDRTLAKMKTLPLYADQEYPEFAKWKYNWLKKQYKNMQEGGQKETWYEKVLREKQEEDAAYEMWLDQNLGSKKEDKTYTYVDPITNRTVERSYNDKQIIPAATREPDPEKLKAFLNSIDLAKAQKELAETAFELTGVPSAARVIEGVTEDPLGYTNELISNATQITELPFEAGMTLGSYLFGDGNNYINYDANPGPLLDVVGGLPVFGVIGKGSKLFKIARTGSKASMVPVSKELQVVNNTKTGYVPQLQLSGSTAPSLPNIASSIGTDIKTIQELKISQLNRSNKTFPESEINKANSNEIPTLNRVQNADIIEQAKIDQELHDAAQGTDRFSKEDLQFLEENKKLKQRFIDLVEGKNVSDKEIDEVIAGLTEDKNIYEYYLSIPADANTGSHTWHNHWVSVYDGWISKLNEIKQINAETTTAEKGVPFYYTQVNPEFQNKTYIPIIGETAKASKTSELPKQKIVDAFATDPDLIDLNPERIEKFKKYQDNLAKFALDFNTIWMEGKLGDNTKKLTKNLDKLLEEQEELQRTGYPAFQEMQNLQGDTFKMVGDYEKTFFSALESGGYNPSNGMSRAEELIKDLESEMKTVKSSERKKHYNNAIGILEKHIAEFKKDIVKEPVKSKSGIINLFPDDSWFPKDNSKSLYDLRQNLFQAKADPSVKKVAEHYDKRIIDLSWEIDAETGKINTLDILEPDVRQRIEALRDMPDPPSSSVDRLSSIGTRGTLNKVNTKGMKTSALVEGRAGDPSLELTHIKNTSQKDLNRLSGQASGYESAITFRSKPLKINDKLALQNPGTDDEIERVFEVWSKGENPQLEGYINYTKDTYISPEEVSEVVAHEDRHINQWLYNYLDPYYKYVDKYKYFVPEKGTELGDMLSEVLIDPKEVDFKDEYDYSSWLSSPIEVDANLVAERVKFARNKFIEAKQANPNATQEELLKDIIKDMKLPENRKKFIEELMSSPEGNLVQQHFKSKFTGPIDLVKDSPEVIATKESIRQFLEMLPVLLIGLGLGASMSGEGYKKGGSIDIELDEAQVQDYIKKGYILDEL